MIKDQHIPKFGVRENLTFWQKYVLSFKRHYIVSWLVRMSYAIIDCTSSFFFLSVRQRRDSYRNHADEEEPEWFTGGPTSQNDTIELRGFEKNEEKKPKKKGEEVVHKQLVVKEIDHVIVEERMETDESNEENKDIRGMHYVTLSKIPLSA